jgi:predicted nucleic acid-binding protein
MIYIDTSALVPAFIREPRSEAVIAWLESSGARLALSEWCLVEFSSAASIKVRAGELPVKLAKEAKLRLNDFARKHCRVAVPGYEEFWRAAELASNAPLKLRAGDALHLAIAAALKAEAILCFDTDMIEAAKSLGMGVAAV